MDYLKPEEIAKLISAAKGQVKTLIMVAALTGMRQSEILGLKWGDVDFASGKIYVRRTLQNKQFCEPKNDTSKRTLSIPSSLTEELKIHQTRQTVELDRNPDDLVFTDDNGEPLGGWSLARRVLKPVCKLAEIREVGWHTLRHSYVSILLSQGADIKFIQNQVGHASAKITLDVYSHMLPGKEQETMQKLEAAIIR